jgi:hypothetical protein
MMRFHSCRGRIALLIPGALVAAFMLLASCGPDTGFNAVGDYDVVMTLYNGEIDFSQYATFGLPDSVVHLTIPGQNQSDNITWIYDQTILDKIGGILEARGYTKVNPHLVTPDIFVLVGVTIQEWDEFPYLHHWWDNWSWYPYWPGWEHTWTVAYPSQYSDRQYYFAMGTLFIDIIDTEHADAVSETIPCRWTAVLNGALGSKTAQSLSQIEVNIEQAFSQSPYISGN